MSTLPCCWPMVITRARLASAAGSAAWDWVGGLVRAGVLGGAAVDAVGRVGCWAACGSPSRGHSATATSAMIPRAATSAQETQPGRRRAAGAIGTVAAPVGMLSGSRSVGEPPRAAFSGALPASVTIRFRSWAMAAALW